MIPENKKKAVELAMQQAFGTDQIDDISELTAGLSSALIFRITVLGAPYLLRVILRTDAMGDPAIHFVCMQTAAEAGIAPRVWYVSVEDRICITDYITPEPLSVHVARLQLPALIRSLQSLPPFPYRLNYLDTVDGFIQKFQEAQIMPPEATDEIFRMYKVVADNYRSNNEGLVSCHNDLKPENILFDGERVWIVDWEAASLNDRYFDLAMVANFVVMSSKDEHEFLSTYLGHTPNEYHHARFFLMQQVAHMAYFTFFSLLVHRANANDIDITAPGFREFHDLIWAGKVSLADIGARKRYALVHLQQMSQNLRSERFSESLRIVTLHSQRL